jgi:hypothetical protein
MIRSRGSLPIAANISAYRLTSSCFTFGAIRCSCFHISTIIELLGDVKGWFPQSEPAFKAVSAQLLLHRCRAAALETEGRSLLDNGHPEVGHIGQVDV